VRAEQVQVVSYRDTGGNAPNEFLFAAVDEHGVLHQYSGVDEDIAQTLVSIARTGSIEYFGGRKREAEDLKMNAAERGDTPDMPRNVPAAIPEGEKPPTLGLLGTKPQ
jgi:hypothetical protein